MSVSCDFAWQLDGIQMGGTILRPDGSGPFPAVVLVAGSGPTDRNWCSPLLPGNNGSGKLLAQELAKTGIASIRYDKRASGPYLMENLPQLTGNLSMESHLDELVSAVEVLSEYDFVDSSRIIGLGNSEGTLHVLHDASRTQRFPFSGLVLADPPGRPISAALLSQLALQAVALPDSELLMDKVKQAVERYSAGAAMNLDPELPENVRMLLASFEVPANLTFARELWNESACDALRAITIPTLVLIAEKDLQIDVTADGDPLRQAASGLAHVSFAFPSKANHVFKEELRTRPELVAAPVSGYNEESTRLDPQSVEIIGDWLRTVFQ
ncbi:alpha/beta hydrolase [Arthrobacter sp. MYb227]|uniref:alpha/beta hydrolase family protein n=1 Tax=Arthrobacter sp. MYb227 TaxID=1848601 RepID=UPI000CFD00D4|nr:alpha/beta fold hydrolase [Arthrobacter sp. MYb227]PQZ86689.1 alpha/beta hydrolase [Arthrobacter sp. MYb227]